MGHCCDSVESQAAYAERKQGGVSMKALITAGLLLIATPCLTQQSLAQQSVPQIPFDSVADFPKRPDGMNFGEVPGVAVNSKGHVFVFTRSNSANGPAYAPTAAQLLEFTAEGDFVHEIGKGLYAWAFAHSVRIDKDDNIHNVYVGDRTNPRIQVSDTDGKFLRMFQINVPPDTTTRAVYGPTPTG